MRLALSRGGILVVATPAGVATDGGVRGGRLGVAAFCITPVVCCVGGLGMKSGGGPVNI